MNYIIAFISVVHIVYIASIWLTYGVQPSISDSWYALGKKHPLFTLYLWAIGLSIAIIGGLTLNVFYFLSGACLCFTGAAAEFKQRITKTVHVIGAIGGIVLVFAGQVYVSLWIRHEGLKFGAEWNQAAWFVLLAILIYRSKRRQNKTWWVENAAVVYAVFGLLIEFNPYSNG